MQKNNKVDKKICNWCGNFTEVVWVHGHGQCKICRTNIDECCRGENCTSRFENESIIKVVSKKEDGK